MVLPAIDHALLNKDKAPKVVKSALFLALDKVVLEIKHS